VISQTKWPHVVASFLALPVVRYSLVVKRWSRVRFLAAEASTGMDDRLWVGKPPQYFTKPPGQLSLLPWAGREWLEVKAGMAHSTCEQTCGYRYSR